MSAKVVPIDGLEEKAKTWPYQTDKVVLLPYAQNKTWVFPEDFLGTLYYRLREDDLLDTIFPGMGFKHVNNFIAHMAHAKAPLVCCLKGEQYPQPIGFGWLCETDGVDGARKGSFGFGFFKEVWGRKNVLEHIDLSMMMLHWWFVECKVDILYGTTINPKAFNYSRRFGFKPLCVLPKFFCNNGALVNAYLIVLEKEVFLPVYDKWRARRG